MINKVIKRIFDIISSFLAIVLLIPLWIIIPIVIKKESKGPVFFKQGRLTKEGRVFKMLKFRSMVVNAEGMGAGLFNYENDPRVTKVGLFLRKSSIDELPQLFNIFIGDMSLVGPRPCVIYELGDYSTLNSRYKKRFSMKAGLTGLAQVKGRNDISWDEKVTYDNQYIDFFEKYGVLIDVKLLLDSVLKVFKRDEIFEHKVDSSLSDSEAAEIATDEIIRLAHLPDEKKWGL
ncbi:MAG: sugar transferase [Candidatus Cloacimonetes bacterium]|nr:sugar transferase [Candidatus Cloacimonadota bacterium]